QQNAALVEEVAAAAGSLQDLAQSLVASVSVFTLAEGARAAAPPRAAAPARAAALPRHAAPAKHAAAAKHAAPAKHEALVPARAADDDDADWQTF
ncbi:MAG: methyl-accepting chemotaxis protein, partial [Candidatus Velthaea sp.]